MSNTVNNLLFLDGPDGPAHQSLVAFFCEPDQLPSSMFFELRLHLGKRQLNWIVFWAVRDVPDPSEAEPLHLVSWLICLVGAQIVHEECHLVVAGLHSQLSQPPDEPFCIDRELVDLEVLQAVLLRNGHEQGQRGLAQLCLVDWDVLLGQSPLFARNGLPGEHCLIKVDHAITVVFRHCELPLHPCKIFPYLRRRWGRVHLEPSELFLPDLAPPVDPS